VSRSTHARTTRRFLRLARVEPLEPRMMLSWTVLTYMSADNNLESYGVLNVNQMETVGSTSAVKLAVQMDRIPGYDSTNGNWTDTRRALITRDTNRGVMSSSFQTIGEADMGDPNVLANFIRWGVANCPADHYVLNLWNHGGGISGVCWDDTNASDYLSVREVRTAISAAGTHFDVVSFDACEMAMAEVRHELNGLTNVVVASERDIPGNGLPYDKICSDLAANPNMTATQLGAAMVTRYSQTYGAGQTLSMTNMATESALVTALNNFAVAAQQSAEWTTISAARLRSAYFTDPTYRDLGTFLNVVGTTARNANLRSAALAASSQYQATVLSNFSGWLSRGTGMSIYLPAPRTAIRSDYTASNFAFVADTQWDEFLARYVSRAAALGVTEVNTGRPWGERTEPSSPAAVREADLPAGMSPTEWTASTVAGPGTVEAGSGAGQSVSVGDPSERLATLDPSPAGLVHARLETVTPEPTETRPAQRLSAAAADWLFAEDRAVALGSLYGDTALLSA
jgi:hypothetical protein